MASSQSLLIRDQLRTARTYDELCQLIKRVAVGVHDNSLIEPSDCLHDVVVELLEQKTLPDSKLSSVVARRAGCNSIDAQRQRRRRTSPSSALAVSVAYTLYNAVPTNANDAGELRWARARTDATANFVERAELSEQVRAAVSTLGGVERDRIQAVLDNDGECPAHFENKEYASLSRAYKKLRPQLSEYRHAC